MRDALQSFRAKYPRECLFPGGNFFRSAYLSSCDADVFTYFQAHLVTDNSVLCNGAYLIRCCSERCPARCSELPPGGDTCIFTKETVSTAQVFQVGVLTDGGQIFNFCGWRPDIQARPPRKRKHQREQQDGQHKTHKTHEYRDGRGRWK